MKLKYMLDTNICIYIVKQKPISVLKRFEKTKQGELGMSVVTYGELLYGAEKSQHSKKAKQIINELIDIIPCQLLTEKTGECYGRIRAMLEKQGKPIGNNDLWIAAHAQSLNVTLVSNNIKEFSRISHLKVENWV